MYFLWFLPYELESYQELQNEKHFPMIVVYQLVRNNYLAKVITLFMKFEDGLTGVLEEEVVCEMLELSSY